jgi:type IV pilus assembly protein PilA
MSSRFAQGFTLVELMIVTAIVGVLLSIAVPSYRNYIGRGQLGEAFELASGVKARITEYYGQTSAWPTNGVAGIMAAASITGKYVDTVAVSAADGSVTVQMKNAGLVSELLGKTVTLTPNVAGGGTMFIISWTCTTTAPQVLVALVSCTGL